MSIAQEIEHYATGLGEAYDAVEAKYGTVTGDKNLDNLDAAIGTIPAGIPREVDSDGRYNKDHITSFKLPDNATLIGSTALYYAFYNDLALTSIDLNNVVGIDGNGASACSNMCYNCQNLLSISAPKLEYIWGTSVFNSAFRQCYKLTTVTFPVLRSITGNTAFSNAFRQCTNLTTVSFPALNNVGNNFTSQFDNMLQSCSNVVVHFPAAMQSVIGSWSSVTAGFGGTNTTVLFDL